MSGAEVVPGVVVASRPALGAIRVTYATAAFQVEGVWTTPDERTEVMALVREALREHHAGLSR